MTLPKILPVEGRKAKRVRCPAHTSWVRRHACCVPGCARRPIEAHHWRYGLPAGDKAGTGQKPGDQWTISLCSGHHQEIHISGCRTFEETYDIDGLALAREFAGKSPHRENLRRRAAA